MKEGVEKASIRVRLVCPDSADIWGVSFNCINELLHIILYWSLESKKVWIQLRSAIRLVSFLIVIMYNRNDEDVLQQIYNLS